MDTEERLSLIKEVGEEILTVDELRQLLEAKAHPVAYDGFEPSGTDIHIAQGLLRAINVNKMTKAGCKFIMLAADWHAFANNKLGGDLEKIQKVGDYMIEVWKVCGMDLKNVDFVRSSDIVNDPEYWKSVLNIARENTVTRITRCAQIMGRSEKDTLSAAQIFYPCMQAADIFYLKADITQLGMDQRKVNVLAREIGPKLGFWKPVVVSHHMLVGLTEPEKIEEEIKDLVVGEEEEILGNYILKLDSIDNPAQRKRQVGGDFLGIKRTSEMIYGKTEIDESVAVFKLKDLMGFELEEIELLTGRNIATKTGMAIERLDTSGGNTNRVRVKVSPGKLHLTRAVKMSKSKPESAIFMNDSEESIKIKIDKAYCPVGIVENNPILEYCKYILFEKFKNLKVERPHKWGGDVELGSYNDLEKAFAAKKLHPTDLKRSVALYLNALLEPIRKRLESNKKVRELLSAIKKFEVTR